MFFSIFTTPKTRTMLQKTNFIIPTILRIYLDATPSPLLTKILQTTHLLMKPSPHTAILLLSYTYYTVHTARCEQLLRTHCATHNTHLLLNIYAFDSRFPPYRIVSKWYSSGSIKHPVTTRHVDHGHAAGLILLLARHIIHASTTNYTDSIN